MFQYFCIYFVLNDGKKIVVDVRAKETIFLATILLHVYFSYDNSISVNDEMPTS
jgi:hypothetical protein